MRADINAKWATPFDIKVLVSVKKLYKFLNSYFKKFELFYFYKTCIKKPNNKWRTSFLVTYRLKRASNPAYISFYLFTNEKLQT